VDVLAAGLEKTGGEGVPEVLQRLKEQAVSANRFLDPDPLAKPVCAMLPELVAEAAMAKPGLAAAIAAVSDNLHWSQTKAYSDALLGDGFMANYAHCEIVGATGFFPGDDFRLGLLILGPNRHYLDHYHPAPELYWPLTGPTEWKKGGGPFVKREAGEVIWHKPHEIHATITRDTPLLAVWCWPRDTETPARLCAA
jgi:hypothetical protein